jgi:hypothetical protein
MEQQHTPDRAGENTSTEMTLQEPLCALKEAREETTRELALLHEELAARHAEEQLRALVQQHTPDLWRDTPTGGRQKTPPWRTWFFWSKR